MAQDSDPIIPDPGMVTPTGDDMDEMFTQGAPLANRFYISITPAGARIAFAEQYLDRVPVVRSSVLLAFQDAYALSKVLKDLLDANTKMLAPGDVVPPVAQPKVPDNG